MTILLRKGLIVIDEIFNLFLHVVGREQNLPMLLCEPKYKIGILFYSQYIRILSDTYSQSNSNALFKSSHPALF